MQQFLFIRYHEAAHGLVGQTKYPFVVDFQQLTFDSTFILRSLDNPCYILIMISPVSGCFLLATPLLDGSWFQGKVIFLADHNVQNSYGFAINHSAQIPIDEVFSGFHSKVRMHFRFFFGGPVQEDQVQVLEFGHGRMKNTREVVPGVWFHAVGEEESIPILDLLAEPTTRIILGYSGWSSGQLELEIQRGCWEIITPDPTDIFSRSRDELIASPATFKKQFAPN